MKKVLILSDVHVPYQNRTAVKKALAIGKREKVDTIILNGDILDCYSISRFQKNPKHRNFKREIEAGRIFLSDLRKQFPKARIIYKMGNHEERLTAYLWNKAEDFSDFDELTLQSLLEFKKHRIIHSPKDEVIKLGKLSVIHGHEAGGICTVYPSRSLFLTANTNAIAGHCHRQSSFVKRTINGEVVRTFTTGCLCQLKADYSIHNDWTHGCAVVTVKDSGDFAVAMETL